MGIVELTARVFRFFKSLKLALLLILYLLISSALASLIPQNRPPVFYLERYPALLLALGLDHFFRSALFLFPALLFFVNLAVCSFARFHTRLRGRSAHTQSLGPDLLHLGLLLLMVAGALSLFGRRGAHPAAHWRRARGGDSGSDSLPRRETPGIYH